MNERAATGAPSIRTAIPSCSGTNGPDSFIDATWKSGFAGVGAADPSSVAEAMPAVMILMLRFFAHRSVAVGAEIRRIRFAENASIKRLIVVYGASTAVHPAVELTNRL